MSMEVTLKDRKNGLSIDIEDLEVSSVTEATNLIELLYAVKNNLMRVNRKRIDELIK